MQVFKTLHSYESTHAHTLNDRQLGLVLTHLEFLLVKHFRLERAKSYALNQTFLVQNVFTMYQMFNDFDWADLEKGNQVKVSPI